MSYCPLDRVESYLRRFVAYPSEHALVAHTLWIAHTHLIECFDTTPRLAFMSAEKMSGKTRALEVSALFVREPILSISASPAVIVRLISAGSRTILYDEIDGVFGSSKAQESNIDLRSVLNGGYRRGAKVHRCIGGSGKKIETEELDAFAPVAVAGLRQLPDTLASRSIFIQMKRRAPGEHVEPFRHRYHSPQAKPIKEALEGWCSFIEADLMGSEPAMPQSIEDRSAECWEPLLAIADVAKDDWPKRAREAAVFLTKGAEDELMTSGVELLAHIRDAFGTEEHLSSTMLLERLCTRDESPWADVYGKPLDGRGLAKRLKGYGIKSHTVRIGAGTAKGYSVSDFTSDWDRYLPAIGHKSHKGHIIDNEIKFVTDVTDISQDIEFEERAAIREYDGGMPRAQAETMAAAEIPDVPDFMDRRLKRGAA